MTQSHVDALYARDATCQSLGISIDEVERGRAVLRMRVTKAMTNGHGMAHGGFLFLLADAAFAYACNSAGPTTVAQSAEVTFLRPAAAGDVLTAEARGRDRNGRAGLYDVTVTRHGNEVISEFLGRGVTLHRPQPVSAGLRAHRLAPAAVGSWRCQVGASLATSMSHLSATPPGRRLGTLQAFSVRGTPLGC